MDHVPLKLLAIVAAQKSAVHEPMDKRAPVRLDMRVVVLRATVFRVLGFPATQDLGENRASTLTAPHDSHEAVNLGICHLVAQ
jgi:hypothetical protein